MKKLLLFFGILIAPNLFGQNYFINSGFENYSQCPTYTSQITYCLGMEEGIGTSDFYNCGYFAPSTIGPYGIPKSGGGCAGFIVGPPTIYNSGTWYGETLKTTLLQNLKPGASYEISADILRNPMNSSPTISDCFVFGFLFYKSTANDSFPLTGCISYTPQVIILPSSINTNYTNFKRTFIADSCFDKVMIGFFCNDSTFSNQCMHQDNSFYLDLDNISLVKINDSPIETKGFEASSTKICINDCVSFSDTGTINNYSWNWEFNGSLTASSTENNPTNICYPSIGTYDVTFISNYECGADTIFKPGYIEVSKPPEVYIEENTQTPCTGIEIQLNAISNSTINWNTGFFGNSINVNRSGIYIAYSENQCGIASDTIIKEFENCACNLFLPKAFSPNGDSNNENFKVYYECVLKSFSLSIRNRWGQEIFKTNDPDQTWNGIYNGRACPSDVYVALVEYTGYKDGIVKSYSTYSTVTLLY